MWISPIFSTASVVYLALNWLDKHCIGLESNLDKKRIVHKKAASAQLVLWIFNRLSTEEVLKHTVLACRRGSSWVDGARKPTAESSGKLVGPGCWGQRIADFFLSSTKTFLACSPFRSGHEREFPVFCLHIKVCIQR
jgi:hypothetical protein